MTSVRLQLPLKNRFDGIARSGSQRRVVCIPLPRGKVTQPKEQVKSRTAKAGKPRASKRKVDNNFVVVPNSPSARVCFQMFHAIDIDIDYYGPKIVIPKRAYDVWKAENGPPGECSNIVRLNFPNDKDISQATLQDEQGDTCTTRVTVFCSDITVYKDADGKHLDGGDITVYTDADGKHLDGGGVCFVIQDEKSSHVPGTPSKRTIVALTQFLIRNIAHQGMFSINIFSHTELPIDVPLRTTAQMDDLQCDDHVFIAGNMTSRSLELILYDGHKPAEPAVGWKWIWGVN